MTLLPSSKVYGYGGIHIASDWEGSRGNSTSGDIHVSVKTERKHSEVRDIPLFVGNTEEGFGWEGKGGGLGWNRFPEQLED